MTISSVGVHGCVLGKDKKKTMLKHAHDRANKVAMQFAVMTTATSGPLATTSSTRPLFTAALSALNDVLREEGFAPLGSLEQQAAKFVQVANFMKEEARKKYPNGVTHIRHTKEFLPGPTGTGDHIPSHVQSGSPQRKAIALVSLLMHTRDLHAVDSGQPNPHSAGPQELKEDIRNNFDKYKNDLGLTVQSRSRSRSESDSDTLSAMPMPAKPAAVAPGVLDTQALARLQRERTERLLADKEGRKVVRDRDRDQGLGHAGPTTQVPPRPGHRRMPVTPATMKDEEEAMAIKTVQAYSEAFRRHLPSLPHTFPEVVRTRFCMIQKDQRLTTDPLYRAVCPRRLRPQPNFMGAMGNPVQSLTSIHTLDSSEEAFQFANDSVASSDRHKVVDPTQDRFREGDVVRTEDATIKDNADVYYVRDKDNYTTGIRETSVYSPKEGGFVTKAVQHLGAFRAPHTIAVVDLEKEDLTPHYFDTNTRRVVPKAKPPRAAASAQAVAEALAGEVQVPMSETQAKAVMPADESASASASASASMPDLRGELELWRARRQTVPASPVPPVPHALRNVTV
jgi:hypothetical protein